MEEGIFFPEWKLERKETLIIYFLLCIENCIKCFRLLVVITLTLYEVDNSVPIFIDEETETQEV